MLTVVTQVRVDPDDPAFQQPTKPIGGFMTEEEARKYRPKAGRWSRTPGAAGGGWSRRPSR